jgi:iron(III) transport system ATP-binding protein
LSVSITFSDVVKKYGNNVIIPDLSLAVHKGEFFTLLGPSGCGKTTLLRMVAGFNSIEGGKIAFDEQVINDMPPARRNIGMVFQNYAVFPHMNVKQNVGFGLTNRGFNKQEIRQKVDAILETVKITEFASRMPDRLSGGQQQRVALARAIVIHPSVLLMDEPLSNLDAKLRIEMRNAIKLIQKEVGITTIYVTHDQEEAMAVSDRIAVMDKGIIQQVGAPKAIYQRPANLFVLSFGNGYSVPYDYLRPEINTTQKVKVSIRPEEFILDSSGRGIEGKILSSVFLGLNTTYFVRLFNGDTAEIVEESSISGILENGTKVHLGLKLDKINVFREDGMESLTAGVVSDAR